MPGSELHVIRAFLSAFARRRAARVLEPPGGFAVYDEDFRHSRADNQVVVDGAVAPEALPGLAEEALGRPPYRLVSVLDDDIGTACAGPLVRAGYARSVRAVMRHEGPVPPGRSAAEVELDALRVPLARRWRGFLPGADEEGGRRLVDRREARRRGADVVRFLSASTADGEVAAWGDPYLDPATGTAQIEDLVTSEAHLGCAHGDAVPTTALRLATDAGRGTRFLIADASDWPRGWYERRGFAVIGHTRRFTRG
ncbi:GNAT family N-acetyltransferase [Streptomyces griseoaurantiacus]|uniref:GNAT family N-acetyltransferase n=1 Tax=Streptomyces griseoaurantiacus TaxID=68213 RepID=UPI0037B78A12